MTEREREILKQLGVRSKKAAIKKMNAVEPVDFGFFAQKLDLEQLERLRKEYFGERSR